MTISLNELDISALSIADRIQLAQDLLDSVRFDTQGETLTAEQLAEIDRRVAASDAGKIVGEPIEEVFRQLLKK